MVIIPLELNDLTSSRINVSSAAGTVVLFVIFNHDFLTCTIQRIKPCVLHACSFLIDLGFSDLIFDFLI